MKRQQGNQTAGVAISIFFAVIAATGWYFYYDQLQLNKSVSNILNSEKDALDDEVQNLQQALRDSHSRNKQLSNQNNALKSDLTSSHEEKSELQKNMQQELERITAANAELQQELESTTTASAEYKQELKRMITASTELQQQLQKQVSEQESLNQQISMATGTSDQLAARLEQEQERRRQLQQQIDDVSNDIGLKEKALSDANENFAELNRQLEQTQQEQNKLKATVEELNRRRVNDAEHFAKLKDALENELNESRVVISQLKNRMTVITLTNEVLFNSGSAEIKPAGKKVLSLIAESLNAYPERAISIEGHTDNIPIGKNSIYESNWDLSGARALAALNFFQQKNQVSPNRLQLVGYGENHPVSSNETAEGRALNRRIEIKMLPQE
jgi:chemotaxis protein MotB